MSTIAQPDHPYGDLFDADHYSSQLDRRPLDPVAHFIADGDAAGLDPSPYFSTEFYKATYPDWADDGVPTAFDDWLRCAALGDERRPHPLIDPGWYRTRYPDVAALGADQSTERLTHFARFGDRECRQPSVAFDADFYRRAYLPLAATRPFRHFVTRGRRAGHLPRPRRRSATAAADVVGGLVGEGGRWCVLGVHDAQRAGVPLLALDLAAVLLRRGWRPLFVLLDGGPLLEEFRRTAPTFMLREGWPLSGIVAGVGPGAPVIASSAPTAEIAAAFARQGNPSLLAVHEMRGYLVDRGLLAPLRDAVAAGTRIVVSSPVTAEAVHDDLGPLPVSRPGIRFDRVPVSGHRRVRRLLAGRRPRFIGAGYGDERKGFDLFLEAARAIRERAPRAGFVWLGELGANARAWADEALADGLDLTLPGFVDDAGAWYAAADVYLLTSRQDPGPTTLGHALGFGIPFVGYAADLGSLDLVGEHGTVVATGDVGAFVDAALAAVDRESRATRRARRRAVVALRSIDAYGVDLLSRLGATPPPTA